MVAPKQIHFDDNKPMTPNVNKQSQPLIKNPRGDLTTFATTKHMTAKQIRKDFVTELRGDDFVLPPGQQNIVTSKFQLDPPVDYLDDRSSPDRVANISNILNIGGNDQLMIVNNETDNSVFISRNGLEEQFTDLKTQEDALLQPISGEA